MRLEKLSMLDVKISNVQTYDQFVSRAFDELMHFMLYIYLYLCQVEAQRAEAGVGERTS